MGNIGDVCSVAELPGCSLLDGGYESHSSDCMSGSFFAFSAWGHVVVFPMYYKNGALLEEFIWGSICGIAIASLFDLRHSVHYWMEFHRHFRNCHGYARAFFCISGLGGRRTANRLRDRTWIL